MYGMKAIDLALKAGKKRQSLVTGFVHHPTTETIPVYENFCFALALLRSKVAENMHEAKALLEKLLAFQVKGELPVYLHEYPQCKYAGLKQKLYPVIFFILRDFHSILGENVRTTLHQLLDEMPSKGECRSPEDWAEFLILSQITGEDPAPAAEQWDIQTLSFKGQQRQERGEPAVTLYDLFLGEWGGKFSTRALHDHPAHLYASLIYPVSKPLQFSSSTSTLERMHWGEGHPTHSLVLQTKGVLEGEIVHLPEGDVQEEIEIAYYLNLHPENQILVNQQKATTFQLGDVLQIAEKFELKLTLESGEGKFWGHLYRGNRPGQLSGDKFEAYDWVIGLRSVKRSGSCRIRVSLLQKS